MGLAASFCLHEYVGFLEITHLFFAQAMDAQQHLLDAQQQLAEALELQQQVRQARGNQQALELQHGRTFTSKI